MKKKTDWYLITATIFHNCIVTIICLILGIVVGHIAYILGFFH